METEADAIVSRLHAAVASGNADAAVIEATYAALQALPLITEHDRVAVVLGFVRVNDLLLELFGDAAPADMRTNAQSVRAMAIRRYGHDDTPYRRSRRELVSVAERLAGGEAAADVVRVATARLLPDMEDADDSEDVAIAIHAVHAMRAAHEVLQTPELVAPGGDALPMLLGVDVALRAGAIRIDQLGTVQDALLAQRCALDATPSGHARALLALLGIGLRHDPHALPALEPLIPAIVSELTRIEMPVADAAVAPPSHAAQCAALVAACTSELAAGAVVDEHLLQRWVAEMQALGAVDGNEPALTLDTMVQVVSLAEQHATGDTRTMVAAQLAALQAMRRQLDSPTEALPPLDADGVAAELKRLRADADSRIAAGETAEVVMTTLFASWPALTLRLGDDADPRAVALLLTGFVDLLSGLEQTVPPDKRELFADTMATMRSVMHDAVAALQAPPDAPPDPLLPQAVSRRMAGLLDGVRDEQPEGVAPWGIQLVEGLGLLTARIVRVCDERGLRRDDEEAARLKGRADVVLGRLRGAGADPVRFAAQLQKGLRPFLLDLRRFERRHHAMLVSAPYPPRSSTPDASAVHMVVCDALRPLVEAALDATAMVEATPFGAGDPLQLRWHHLRRAAVAVLDYTAYDPAQADPPGPLPVDAAQQAARLAAAAPVAATAFEHGWAMALGTPVIPLVRAGAPLPFDVTAASVALRDDGHDLDRLAAAIHSALLPDEWLGDPDSVQPTVAQLHAAFADVPGTAELLAAAGDGTDGMALVLAAEALIQRAPGGQRMLAFPGFAPAYPDPSAPPLVFHVTAFRAWSEACEQEVRAACARAGWRYAIGYERLDPNIMAAIWRDVAQAALVVADVTSLNPNAVLELGLAHGLGRPLVVLSRQPDTPRWLPALAKVRVHVYEAESRTGRAALAALLDDHLARFGSVVQGG